MFRDYTNFTASIESMSFTCLHLLRTEIRLHCFYLLELSFREGDYVLEEGPHMPDQYVTNLANDLVRFEALVSQWLPYSRYQ